MCVCVCDILQGLKKNNTGIKFLRVGWEKGKEEEGEGGGVDTEGGEEEEGIGNGRQGRRREQERTEIQALQKQRQPRPRTSADYLK